MFKLYQRYTNGKKGGLPGRGALRKKLLILAAFLLLGGLGFQFTKTYLVQRDSHKEEVNPISLVQVPILPIRGSIFDRYGYPIAYTVPSRSLYFRVEQDQPQDEVILLAKRLEDVFTKVQRATPLTAEEIIVLMDVGYDIHKSAVDQRSPYHVPRKIFSYLSHEEMAFLKENPDQFPWLEIIEEHVREYESEHTLEVQLVGYMRPIDVAQGENGLQKYRALGESEDAIYLEQEFVGYDGIELMYQDQLRGQNGLKTYEVDAEQKIIRSISFEAPQRGNHIYLTIDHDVQRSTEKAIADQLTFLKTAKKGPAALGRNAAAGYAVAIEVETGKVVAMASLPDYSPNIWMGDLSRDELLQQFSSFTINGTIRAALPNHPQEEQGKHSTSVVNMGAAINPLSVLIGFKESIFGVGTRYHDTGEYDVGRNSGIRITNSDPSSRGSINAMQAIQYSSNTFMAAMVGAPFYVKHGDKALHVWDGYLAKFGLGVSTESDLPFEHEGINEFLTNTRESAQSRMIYASLGQNEKYTTLQLAQYAATLATRGKRIKPILVDRIESPEGKHLTEEINTLPVILDEIEFADAHWEAVLNGMTKLPVQGFEGFPYEFARMTGASTQVVGGRLIDNAVFAAFAPADKPKLAVAVVVPEGGLGSWGAAPIARKIFDAYDLQFGLDGTPKQERTIKSITR